ncbi:hypothetical protein C6570_05665 [Ottowia oryzae]|uniref:Uncharacterized protein n=1 Tax=Ottowia oryzae TaxID=2109914 RepID=A0A2S0MD20_9BURK|nr:hypothetical protein C6570_05665 [Ottowia oryzae]
MHNVTLLDIFKNTLMFAGETLREHIEIINIENRLTLQWLLRKDEIYSINEMKPYQLRCRLKQLGLR